MNKFINILFGEPNEKSVTKTMKKVAKKEYRDAMDIELLNELLNTLPRKSFTDKRFILCILLLYITGCRINELQNFNYYTVKTLAKEGTLVIYTFKNRSTRRIDISNNEKMLLNSYDELFLQFYSKIPLKKSILSTSAGRDMNNRAVITWFNRRLDTLGKKHELNLKSHSFRIGYITNLLRTHNAQIVKSIIGHSDIKLLDLIK